MAHTIRTPVLFFIVAWVSVPTTDSWTRRVIGTIGSSGKDTELDDFDGNGKLDAATRSSQHVYIFFQRNPNIWNRVQSRNVEGGECMGEGMLMGTEIET